MVQLWVQCGCDKDWTPHRARTAHARRSSIHMALLLSLTGVSSTLTASGFVPHYDYTGTLAVSGTVGPMTTTSGTQTYFAQLTGVDPLCAAAAGPAANSCGFHIHENPTCTANAGGHYYTVATDPWTSVSYSPPTLGVVANNGGTMQGSFTVTTGATESQLTGKSMIVHNYAGNRIACAILGTGAATDTVFEASAFVPYFDYTGTLAVAGEISSIASQGTTQTFSIALFGVDTRCVPGPGTAANSCGVHIHPTCTANAGGHYYTGAVTTDPWTNINYATGQAAATPANGGTMVGTYSVNTGATSAQIAGKSFLVHDYDGNRIACGIIGQTDTSACSSWCNEYTCGFGSCSSCYTCQLPPCSSWCAHCIPPPPASSRCSQSIPRHASVCATTHL